MAKKITSQQLATHAAVVALVTTLAPALAAPVPVTVLNPGFELPELGEGAATNNSVPSWTLITSCWPQCFGVHNPAVGDPGFPSGTVAEGTNSAYIGSIGPNFPLWQTLSATLEADTTYTLTVAAGNPANRPDTATFGFEIGLVGSTQKLANFTGSLGLITNGSFMDFSASTTVLAGNADTGRTMIVRLYGPQAPGGRGSPTVYFDNVRLTAEHVSPVPEPTSLLLSVLGLGGLAGWRRRCRAGGRVGRRTGCST